MLEDEQRVFEKWAVNKIQKCQEEGKNALPLLKELKSYKY